jgi:hypothetical protein
MRVTRQESREVPLSQGAIDPSQWDDLVRVEQSAYRAAVRGLLNRQQLIWARQAAGGGLDPASAPPLDRDGLIAGARARPDLPGTLAAMGEVQERLRGDSRSMAEEAAALMDKLRAVLARTSGRERRIRRSSSTWASWIPGSRPSVRGR